MILTIITGTVVVLEIVGPLLVKWSVHKAKETNQKVTKELPAEKPSLALNLPITPIIEEKAKATEKSKRISAGFLSSISNQASSQKTDSAKKMSLQSEQKSNKDLIKGD